MKYCNKFNTDFKNGPHKKILKKKRNADLIFVYLKHFDDFQIS